MRKKAYKFRIYPTKKQA
ncbi:TPA: helix-turn-helix domain-containing protein, partial [Clostridium perfringens]